MDVNRNQRESNRFVSVKDTKNCVYLHGMTIRWPKKVSNEKVYEIKQLKPWRQTIKICKMKWFGNSIRLPDNTPTKTTFKYLNEETKRPRGPKRTTWKKMMEKI